MKISWLVLDVDGVLTNGKLIYTSSGEEIKSFNVKDGLGLAAARQSGVKLAIITARTSPMVERRAKELHFDALQMGSGNKAQSLQRLCEERGVSLDEVAYMGDDLNDLGALSIVGLSLAPGNAVPEVKSRVDFVTTAIGGAGAVREAVEFILKKQDLWDNVIQSYLQESYIKGQ